MYQSTLSFIAFENGVNSKVGKYFRSLALLAVFLYCPSALVVSKTIFPLKLKALTSSSANSLMETSDSSSTEKRTGEKITNWLFC